MFLPLWVQGLAFHRRIVPSVRCTRQIQSHKRVSQPIWIFRVQVLGLNHLDVQANLWRLFRCRLFQQLGVLLIVEFKCILHVREQRLVIDVFLVTVANVVDDFKENFLIQLLNLSGGPLFKKKDVRFSQNKFAKYFKLLRLRFSYYCFHLIEKFKAFGNCFELL